MAAFLSCCNFSSFFLENWGNRKLDGAEYQGDPEPHPKSIHPQLQSNGLAQTYACNKRLSESPNQTLTEFAAK